MFLIFIYVLIMKMVSRDLVQGLIAHFCLLSESEKCITLLNPQLLMLFIVIFKENLGHLITMKFVPNETV